MQLTLAISHLFLAAVLLVTPPLSLAEDALSKRALDEQRRVNSLHLHAQLLCSGVFVSGRLAEDVIRDDLQWRGYTFHDWSHTAWTIATERETVTLTNTEGSASTEALAIHNPGHGCTLPVRDAPRRPRQSTLAAVERPLLNQPLPDHTSAAISAWLDRAFESTADGESDAGAQNTRAVLVLQGGRIVAERYATGFGPTVPMLGWSMGKSVAAALLGVFAKETPGFDIDEAAPISRWSTHGDKRSAITTRHLLNMASGLQFANPGKGDPLYYTDAHQHESVYFRPQDTRELVLQAPLVDRPGAVFAYRNTNTLSLMALIRQGNESTRQNHNVWPYDRLFRPLGAESFVLEQDHSGNFVISGFVYATARDWARLGQLFLDEGKVEGQSLWPANWTETVTMPSAAAPFYGGQVWLNTQRSFQSVPTDAYYFLGWLDQIVLVVPSMRLVIVRLGFSDQGGFREYFDPLLKSLLQILKD